MVPNKTPILLISTCHALVANMSRNVNQILVQLQDCLMQHLGPKETIRDKTPAVAQARHIVICQLWSVIVHNVH